jgi:hypothetical protein
MYRSSMSRRSRSTLGSAKGPITLPRGGSTNHYSMCKASTSVMPMNEHSRDRACRVCIESAQAALCPCSSLARRSVRVLVPLEIPSSVSVNRLSRNLGGRDPPANFHGSEQHATRALN